MQSFHHNNQQSSLNDSVVESRHQHQHQHQHQQQAMAMHPNSNPNHQQNQQQQQQQQQQEQQQHQLPPIQHPHNHSLAHQQQVAAPPLYHPPHIMATTASIPPSMQHQHQQQQQQQQYYSLPLPGGAGAGGAGVGAGGSISASTTGNSVGGAGTDSAMASKNTGEKPPSIPQERHSRGLTLSDNNSVQRLAASASPNSKTTLTARRGPWAPDEDSRLLDLVALLGARNWVRISVALGSRTPKQCRERYHQNLKPSLNRSPITPEEGALIEELVAKFGKRWAEIARHLNGRSDNAIKNWWNGGANRRRRATSVTSETTTTSGLLDAELARDQESKLTEQQQSFQPTTASVAFNTQIFGGNGQPSQHQGSQPTGPGKLQSLQQQQQQQFVQPTQRSASFDFRFPMSVDSSGLQGPAAIQSQQVQQQQQLQPPPPQFPPPSNLVQQHINGGFPVANNIRKRILIDEHQPLRRHSVATIGGPIFQSYNNPSALSFSNTTTSSSPLSHPPSISSRNSSISHEFSGLSTFSNYLSDGANSAATSRRSSYLSAHQQFQQQQQQAQQQQQHEPNNFTGLHHRKNLSAQSISNAAPVPASAAAAASTANANSTNSTTAAATSTYISPSLVPYRYSISGLTPMSTSNVKLPPLSPRTFVSANTHNNTNNGISRKSSVPSILVNENKLPPLSLGQCPPPQNSSIQQNPANAENTDNKSNTGESVHTVTANVPNDTVFKREFSFANATKKTLANDDSNDHNNNNNNNNKDDQEKREEAEASGGETTNDPREKDVVMVDADRKDVGISLSQQMSSDKSQGSKNEEDKKRMSISNLLA